MKFLKKYRNVIIVAVIVVILLSLATYTFYRMFYPNAGVDVYGSRTEGIPMIENSILENINNKLKESPNVTEVNSRISGALIKFNVTLTENTLVDTSKSLANIILENLEKDITENYDIEINYQGTDTYLPMVGYKSKQTTTFTFTENKESVVEDEG